jgi:hypothetical protein
MTDNELMEAVDGLISDIDGQVTDAACNLRYYMRWGKHYLPSLIRAHVLRQCNNFKDPGIQTYSSPLFEKIRGDAEAQFAKLPPPKPAATSYQYASTTRAAPVNMSQYIDRAGGCIHGECLVLLQNEQYVAVSEIKKGAHIKNCGIVKCVVKTPCSPNQEWIQYGDLIITAWHPVLTESGWWEFPCNIPDAKKIVDNRCEFMYSFVMEGTHYITVEGIYCASLGHGVLDNEVLAHEFLGTNKVLEQLRECRGYENGEVTVQFTRSNASGRLDGLTDISM